jgi:hypothetical protein
MRPARFLARANRALRKQITAEQTIAPEVASFAYTAVRSDIPGSYRDSARAALPQKPASGGGFNGALCNKMHPTLLIPRCEWPIAWTRRHRPPRANSIRWYYTPETQRAGQGVTLAIDAIHPSTLAPGARPPTRLRR